MFVGGFGLFVCGFRLFVGGFGSFVPTKYIEASNCFEYISKHFSIVPTTTTSSMLEVLKPKPFLFCLITCKYKVITIT